MKITVSILRSTCISMSISEPQNIPDLTHNYYLCVILTVERIQCDHNCLISIYSAKVIFQIPYKCICIVYFWNLFKINLTDVLRLCLWGDIRNCSGQINNFKGVREIIRRLEMVPVPNFIMISCVGLLPLPNVSFF